MQSKKALPRKEKEIKKTTVSSKKDMKNPEKKVVKNPEKKVVKKVVKKVSTRGVKPTLLTKVTPRSKEMSTDLKKPKSIGEVLKIVRES